MERSDVISIKCPQNVSLGTEWIDISVNPPCSRIWTVKGWVATNSNTVYTWSSLQDKPFIPSKLSQLQDDVAFLKDSAYTHTDNNFSNDLYNKLTTLESSKYLGTFPTLSSLITKYPEETVWSNFIGSQEGCNAFVIVSNTLHLFSYNNDDWVDLGETNADTAAIIKTKYESNADTNAFTDSLKQKLVNLPTSFASTNNQGQVKITYTGLTLSSFLSGVLQVFDFTVANNIVLDYPTTKWPVGQSAYNPDVFITTTDSYRLRENNVLGQVHRWRIMGTYYNKSVGVTTSLQLVLMNPDSNFSAVGKNYLPANVTQGDFAFEITTIADNNSLDTNKGYVIAAKTSSDDSILTIEITSIVRISEATDLI